MGLFLYRILIGGAGLLAASTFAFAGEQTLEFKFVIKLLEPKVLEAANTDGNTMIASEAGLDFAVKAVEGIPADVRCPAR